jgi:hypothetical protein
MGLRFLKMKKRITPAITIIPKTMSKTMANGAVGGWDITTCVGVGENEGAAIVFVLVGI